MFLYLNKNERNIYNPENNVERDVGKAFRCKLNNLPEQGKS